MTRVILNHMKMSSGGKVYGTRSNEDATGG